MYDMTPYSYIFVRTDLSVPQQIVQAAHASLNAGHQFGSHSHIVLFGIKSEQELSRAADMLTDNGIRHTMFYEPDNNAGYTALVTEPLQGERRKHMKRYQLLQP